MAKELTIHLQMEKITEDVSQETRRAISDAQDKIAKEAVQKLKNTSPKRTGKYARSWAIKRTRTGTGVPDVIIYNKIGQLTHLLEDGHVIRNAHGEYGRYNGVKHMQPVEEWANTALVQEVERLLNK